MIDDQRETNKEITVAARFSKKHQHEIPLFRLSNYLKLTSFRQLCTVSFTKASQNTFGRKYKVHIVKHPWSVTTEQTIGRLFTDSA